MISYKNFKNFFHSWFKHAGLTFTSLFVLTGVFLALVLVFVFFQNVERTLTSFGKFFQLNIYLKPSISEAEFLDIKNVLTSRKEIKKVTFVSKKEALKKFKRLIFLENDEALFGFKNALPSSFEVQLKKSYLGIEQKKTLSHLNQILSSLKGVDEISYGKSIFKNYITFFKIFYYLSILMALALLSGSVFIISNLIQTSLDQRKEEIEILKLVGSTNWNIQKFFLFEGGFVGFLAALFASFFGFLIFSLQVGILKLELKSFIGHLHFKYLSGSQIVSFLFLGLLIGALASFFSTKRICSKLELSS